MTTPSTTPPGGGTGTADDPDLITRLDRVWRERHRSADLFAQQVAALPDHPVTAVLRARATWAVGRMDEALALAIEAEEAIGRPSPGEPDPTGRDLWRARALETTAIVLSGLGLEREAQDRFVEAGRLFEVHGDVVGRAGVLQNSAVLSMHSYERATELFLEALELARRVDAPTLLGVIQLNIGEMALRKGDLAQAQDWVRQALVVLADTWPEVHLKGRCLLAESCLVGGDVAAARDLLADAPRPEEVRNTVVRLALARITAALEVRAGHPERAVRILQDQPADQLSAYEEVQLQTALSAAAEAAGDLRLALAAARRSATISDQLREGDATRQARALDAWHRRGHLLRDRAAAQGRADALEQALAERQAALDELRVAHERIRELGSRDALTGLHNRQHLTDVAPDLIAGSSRERPAQVALMDLDRFKVINDTFGHATGDTVLRVFGEVLRAHLPPTDLVTRYGGEEFVVVRPPAPDGRATASLADDLDALRGVAREALPTPADGQAVPVISVSIGVTTVEHPDLDQALHAADDRMYAAKRAGGDRVWACVAPCLGRPSRTLGPATARPHGAAPEVAAG
ncbi:diguanylate cyclase [Arsenicicoccus dermatophilus]|uniref:diguanylate cyclase n=1 Tax=Arsenicicoccus dermatophilus TaxID=1076331 RepID=UPI0039173BC9